MKTLNEKLNGLRRELRDRKARVMILGLGSVGNYLLDYILSSGDEGLEICVAGRNREKMVSDVNIVKVASLIRGQNRCGVDVMAGVDLNDISAIRDCIRAWKPDALVPVPVHYTRKRERGYNQAEVLAKVIGGKMGIPVEGRLVRRVRKTLPQKLLGDRERQNNLKRAFKIDRNDVKLKTVIIIDDIYTTGSTVDACAAVLKCAGVKKVYFITAAIGKELL